MCPLKIAKIKNKQCYRRAHPGRHSDSWNILQNCCCGCPFYHGWCLAHPLPNSDLQLQALNSEPFFLSLAQSFASTISNGASVQLGPSLPPASPSMCLTGSSP